MALLATIEPGRGGKLALVLILVAIDAQGVFQPVRGRLAGRRMAIGALHLLMRKHQRELGFGVVGRRISGRLPTIDRVATLAAALVCALNELAAMRIRLVAVRAIGKGDRQIEVGALVAGNAAYLAVFAEQRILCLRVVEVRCESGFFPRRGSVAGFAGLLELALVRVGVTVGTVGERNSKIAGLSVGTIGVALLAGYLLVRAG